MRTWHGGVTVVLRDPDETVRTWEAVEREGGIETCSNDRWNDTRFFPWSRVVEMKSGSER